MESIRGYFREVRAELKKVVWPTFKQIQKNTLIVIVCLILVGAIIAVFDAGFGQLRIVLLKDAGVEQNVTPEDGNTVDESGAADFNFEEYFNALSPEEQTEYLSLKESFGGLTAEQQLELLMGGTVPQEQQGELFNSLTPEQQETLQNMFAEQYSGTAEDGETPPEQNDEQ